MDGREAMAFSGGSAPYYIHRGGCRVWLWTQTGGLGFQGPPGFRVLPNTGIPAQSNARAQGCIGASSGTPSASVEPPVKKKRGRPRNMVLMWPVSLENCLQCLLLLILPRVQPHLPRNGVEGALRDLEGSNS
ncbi:putative DNA-binding protein ESCAROLA [Sesbania bispinosa]|nr:putative DNA-binding protein ESCAROLA [Sesbania bispinosa]